ncbi:MAG: hypothetical protein R2824_33085 [Saprospiraceae bacterium]|nr:hypothetical protein [Lewinella sp.]
MEDGKNEKQPQQNRKNWWTNITFIRSSTDLPVKQEGDQEVTRKKRPWWVRALRWTLAAAVVLALKIYFLGGWPLESEYKFKVLDEPAPAAEGTVCDLFRELETKKSVLLKQPGEQVLYQQDSVLESGVEVSMTIKRFGVDGDSTEEELSTEAETLLQKITGPTSIEDINLEELIHFEAMNNGQARLSFADGTCELYDLGDVLRLLREKDDCHLFQAIPYQGQKYEYFNILYTESFEKIHCDEGTFYRARLNISKARCPSVHSLMNCGTDFFSKHIYNKLRKRLEYMDPNNSYAYRREFELFPCTCAETEDD